MSTTFCPRNINEYHIDLSYMTWQMCCHTPRRAVIDIPFHDPIIEERIYAHENNIQHKDCTMCWNLEETNVTSYRLLEPTGLLQRKPRLEISLGNLCDLACRYCSPVCSSVWAERVKHEVFNKQNKTLISNRSDIVEKRNQFYIWLEKNIQTFVNGDGICITGGEPSLDNNFIELLDRLCIPNLLLQINTNLNTPKNRLKELIPIYQKLRASGVRLAFRCSIDGIKEQQEWQRANCKWGLIEDNWHTLGNLDCYLCPAITVTPLTLESMNSLAIWVLSTAKNIKSNIFWAQASIVASGPLSVMKYFSFFQNEIEEMTKVVSNPDVFVIRRTFLKQLESWKNSSSIASDNERIQLGNYLNEQCQKWNDNDWKPIFPKVRSLCFL